MAKQIGIISLTGTINGINFYLRKGKPVARKAGGGFNGKAIQKSPTMIRVRENNTEFGHCSKIKKLFKDSLFPFLGKQRNEELQIRLMQLFLNIKNTDTVSERGKRNIGIGLQTPEGKALLSDFCLTSFYLPTTNGFLTIDTLQYILPGFDTASLHFPQNATLFELQLGIVAMDFDTPKATLHTSSSVYIPKNASAQDIVLTPTLPVNPHSILIFVLHYRFLQEINGVLYGFQEQNNFGIKVVGVEKVFLQT